MNRRRFVTVAGAALAAQALRGHPSHAHAQTQGAAENFSPSTLPSTFQTEDERWQRGYDAALTILAGNVRVLPRVPRPVLIEGAEYAGVWQECAPHEGLVYRRFCADASVARNNHLTFFELQRADGQLPANNKMSEAGFGQIQMVVPIAATAWELAQATGDAELLETAYRACSAWDAWLLRYRNTRGTGLIEGFCTYDTGHDNSPRWAGIPSQCPGKDARRCPPLATLPRLCPDLSATVYGGRMAMSAMARALGKGAEADRWTESAETLRTLILTRLYVAADAAFYDLDAQDRFVRIDCDILSRVAGEHVPEQKLFDELWTRQIHNPKAFWTPYPLPSVAIDDRLFVRPIPRNSWGGPSQALTALRAGRWFDRYGRAAEFSVMMDRWCEALLGDMSFRQQMDPETGMFTAGGATRYSPACLVLLDYTWRLSGPREEAEVLHWNVRPGHASSRNARFRARLDSGSICEMYYDAHGADLRLRDRAVARIEGGSVRLVTGKDGAPQSFTGIDPAPQTVTMLTPDRRRRKFTVRAHETLLLGSGAG